jgi:hypothetical protein
VELAYFIPVDVRGGCFISELVVDARTGDVLHAEDPRRF